MIYKILILFFIITTITHHVVSSNVPEKFVINVSENGGLNVNRNQNKTVQKLVQDQTDIIKKIISSEKEKISDSTSRKPQVENESIEDLHIKCQKLNSAKGEIKTQINERTTVPPAPIETSNQQMAQTPFTRPFNYFYITHNATRPINNQFYPHHYSNSHKNNLELNTNSLNMFSNRNGNQPPPFIQNTPNFSSNVKYVQLEPVILQKMVLNDGKELFYWYKTSDLNSQSSQQSNPSYGTVSSNTELLKITTQKTTTSNIVTPLFQEPSNNPATQLQKSSQQNTPHYDVEYSSTKKDNPVKQMKFIIPIQYPSNDGAEISKRYPWEFDPYAYYPKPLQPLAVRVPMPYVPMFHMIRTLTIPGTNKNENP